MWKQFNKYFKQKYLFDRYYAEKMKGFHGLKLGQINILEEYANKLLEFLSYVKYIIDDKVKVYKWITKFIK